MKLSVSLLGLLAASSEAKLRGADGAQKASNQARILKGKGKGKGKDKIPPFTRTNTHLSIPSDEVDPEGRAYRLAWKSPLWETRPYSETDPDQDIVGIINDVRGESFPDQLLSEDFPFVAPTGILGSSNVLQGAISTGLNQIKAQAVEFDSVYLPAMYGTALGLGGINTLADFAPIYAALPDRHKISSASFYNSDVAFAAGYLTGFPTTIQKVSAVGDIPFDTSTIEGLDDILGGSSLDNLVRKDKLYMIDTTVFGLSAGDAAPGSVIEAPIALFFVDDEDRLQPVAIKFTVSNSNTYSPKDDANDWFLAKAVMNSLHKTLLAVDHFVGAHFALSHVCTSANKYLADEHPVLAIVQGMCTQNDGVIANGVASLLPDGGFFDQLHGISGAALRNTLMPYYSNKFNWNDDHIEADVAARGAKDIPNFHFYEDASTINELTGKFMESFVESYYDSDSLVAEDMELQAFITALSDTDSALKLNGFPSSVTTTDDLADILTKASYYSSTEHHSLNGREVEKFAMVYPHSPSKIAYIPGTKGTLDENTLVKVTLQLGLDLESFLPFFLGTQSFAHAFVPAMSATTRLDSSFFTPFADGSTDAVHKLRDGFIELSARIRKRNQEVEEAGEVPTYDLLDPAYIPAYTVI